MAALPSLNWLTVGQGPVTPQPLAGSKTSLSCLTRSSEMIAMPPKWFGSSGSGCFVVMTTV